MIETILVGDTYDEAAAAAAADARATGATIVPAFDDARTIAGQGTVIREAVEQLGASPDVVDTARWRRRTAGRFPRRGWPSGTRKPASSALSLRERPASPRHSRPASPSP